MRSQLSISYFPNSPHASIPLASPHASKPSAKPPSYKFFVRRKTATLPIIQCKRFFLRFVRILPPTIDLRRRGDVSRILNQALSTQKRQCSEVEVPFPGCDIEDNNLQNLAQVLPNHLKKLTLYLYNNRLQGHTLVTLIKKIQQSAHLQELTLDFSSNEFYSDPMQTFAEHLSSLRQLRKLERLTLNFGENWIPPDAIVRVVKAGTALKSLKYFYLDLSMMTTLNDETVDRIATELCNLSSIKTLELGFDSCEYVTGNIFSIIAPLLPKLPNLRTFTLKIRDVKTALFSSLQAISLFLQGIKKSKILDLRFYFGGTPITDEPLNRIVAHLVDLNLKAFTLILPHCPKISVMGFLNLIYTLKHLNSLEKLELDVNGCSNFMPGLLQYLKVAHTDKFKSLQSLTLSLNLCVKLKNKHIQKFMHKYPCDLTLFYDNEKTTSRKNKPYLSLIEIERALH